MSSLVLHGIGPPRSMIPTRGLSPTVTFESVITDGFGASPQLPTRGLYALPDDILSAIRCVFLGTPALTTAITGGLWLELARPPSMPYATVHEIAWVPEYTTEDAYYGYLLVQMSVYAVTDTQARTLGKLLASYFTPKKTFIPLVWADGYEMTRLPGNTHLIEMPGLVVGNRPAWQQINEIEFLIGRTF